MGGKYLAKKMNIVLVVLMLHFIIFILTWSSSCVRCDWSSSIVGRRKSKVGVSKIFGPRFDFFNSLKKRGKGGSSEGNGGVILKAMDVVYHVKKYCTKYDTEAQF